MILHFNKNVTSIGISNKVPLSHTKFGEDQISEFLVNCSAPLAFLPMLFIFLSSLKNVTGLSSRGGRINVFIKEMLYHK